ncbi:unnamed protein product [Danaus chrysippus]|uniref:(African queen) hypothetical protein n=1 Tax=Danaus chrysippus TaxID=151541 RepID=A0A8J2R3J7_9NEOP|nr:unnamed protein product [Danaus chrysippus]
MSQQLELLTESTSQWISVSYVTPEIQMKEIKPFVALAVKELEGNPDSRISNLMNVNKFAAVRAVVRHVSRLRSAIKEPWNKSDLQTFLESLRFSSDCARELSSLLCSDVIYEKMPKHLTVKPGILSLTWKIDVSLSQSNISSENADGDQAKKIMFRDTRVILLFKLTNGQTYTCRLSVSKLHELRYVVASALKCMIVLEKRKCMRNL